MTNQPRGPSVMPPTDQRRPTGFALLELLVVSVLMTLICLIVAQTWRSWSVELADLAARARAAQELRLAVEGLADDLGPAVAATRMSDSHILICRDGPPAYDGVPWQADDPQVSYALVEGQLLRTNQSSGEELVVADDVTTFEVSNLAPGLFQMLLRVERSGVARQVTLRWSAP